MRTPHPPLIPHDIFKARVRGYEQLLGVPWIRFFLSTGACSEEGARNIMRGTAKQSPSMLAAIGAVAALVVAPRDQVVVGLTLPPVPPEIECVLLDALASEISTPTFRELLTRRKQILLDSIQNGASRAALSDQDGAADGRR